MVQQIHSVLSQIFMKEFLDSNPLIQSQINNVPLSLPLSAIFQVFLSFSHLLCAQLPVVCANPRCDFGS
jgi:hypothetical protein